MSYIYSDLKRSARILLDNGWGTIYRGLLRKDDGWYIDDRANPQAFWALMCIAHPRIASENVKVNKSKIKRAIDLIFQHTEQIRNFERLCADDDDFEESVWFLTHED